MEKNTADNEYDDAIASGNSVVLFKENAEGEAKCLIGNLAPKEECLVKISYVTELSNDGDSTRFVLPISSIYNLQGITNNAPKPSVNIELDVFMASAIKNITSPTYELEINNNFNNNNNNNYGAQIKLKNKDIELKNDLIVLVQQENPFVPRLWVESVTKDDIVDSYFSMAVFYPEHIPEYTKAEFIFVIDQSGTMKGERINDAKNALHILIRSIPEGSKFNIIGFGSNFQYMTEKSVDYNASSFDIATRHVDSMEANLGGTDLNRPLEWIYKQPVEDNYPRQLFVITDGHISNSKAVLQLVTNRIAQNGGGTSIFVDNKEKIERKIIGQLKQSLHQSCTIDIDWSIPATQSPLLLPPLLNNTSCIVYAQTKEEPSVVKISASVNKINDFEMHPQLCPHKGIIQKLFTKSRIQDLKESRNISEIVSLSVQNQVLCSATAFIAFHEKREMVEGTMQSIRIETLSKEKRQHSLGGGRRVPKRILEETIRNNTKLRTIDARFFIKCSSPKINIDAIKQYEKFQRSANRVDVGEEQNKKKEQEEEATRSRKKQKKDEEAEISGSDFSNSGNVHPQRETTHSNVPVSDKTGALMRLQGFDGSWDLDQAFAKVLKAELINLDESKPASLSTKIWATAIAIAVFEIKLTSTKDIWEMALKKSYSFLAKDKSLGIVEEAKHEKMTEVRTKLLS